MRRTRVTETSPSALLQLPDDVLLEIVALLDVDCSSVWPNLCSLRCSSQRLRRLCEAPSLMARLSKVHCTCEWGLRLIVATTFEPHAAALRRLHLARHWWRISFEGLFGLAPKDCDLREAPSRGSGLGKAVLQAARTNRKALLEFFWVVFQCMRDVAHALEDHPEELEERLAVGSRRLQNCLTQPAPAARRLAKVAVLGREAEEALEADAPPVPREVETPQRRCMRLEGRCNDEAQAPLARAVHF